MIRFGSVTLVMNEEDLIGGCLELLDVDEKVVVFCNKSFQGMEYKPDRSEEIARELGATILHSDNPPFQIDGAANDQSVMRNMGIKYLESKGIDYVFITDADEWYSKAAMENIKKFIEENPAEGYSKIMPVSFKYPDWIVHSPHDGGSVICIKSTQRMTNPRRVKFDIKPIICKGEIWHLSYARHPEKLKEKLKHFSHASEVKPGWFDRVFMKATLDSKDVHPTTPDAWPFIYERTLPQEILNLIPHKLWYD